MLEKFGMSSMPCKQMKNSARRFIPTILLVVSGVCFPLHHSAAKGSLEDKEKALNIIADFAERLCRDIPLRGEGKTLELTGKAKAELNGLLKKVANLGVEGAVTYQDKTYNGLLQKDLVKALKASTDCRLEVWRDLKGKIVEGDKPDKSSNKRITNQTTQGDCSPAVSNVTGNVTITSQDCK